MIIEGIIWFDEIIEKLEWKHGVQPREVTEVFVNTHEFRFVEKGYRAGENVYAAMGQTNGDFLICSGRLNNMMPILQTVVRYDFRNQWNQC